MSGGVTVDPAFEKERAHLQRAMAKDAELAQAALELRMRLGRHRYTYNFDWLGLPIIQQPCDIVAIQEVIWSVRPEAVVETGVARGGSLALSASMLELIGGDGIVVGVDVEIRSHNRTAIEKHPLAGRIRLVEGSSTDPETVAKVKSLVEGRSPVVVILDSMHTRKHVLSELELYGPLVTPGSYLVVFDTVIEDFPEDYFTDRPWGPGNGPKSAVADFLSRPGCVFDSDDALSSKLVFSAAPGGFLRRVR
jgi:cephalosporin hydroxylase